MKNNCGQLCILLTVDSNANMYWQTENTDGQWSWWIMLQWRLSLLELIVTDMNFKLLKSVLCEAVDCKHFRAYSG